MTVRWKPLIVLSGLFLVIAAIGLVAITFELGPNRSSDIVRVARTEWTAGRFSRAEIHFQRALQKDPKSAEIHAELARMLGDWESREPGLRGRLRPARLRALAESAKYGKHAEEPRRQLLLDALTHEESAERWATELLALNPADPLAHFALGDIALDASPVDVSAARAHLDVLGASEPNRLRTAWLRARLARTEGDSARVLEILARVRALAPGADLDPTDRIAQLRLCQMDALTTPGPAELAIRIRALAGVARGWVDDASIPSDRLARLGNVLEEVQKHLRLVSGGGEGATGTAEALEAGSALEAITERAYKQALETASAADLRVYQEYAGYLLFREKRQACLELVAKALKLSVAGLPAWADTAAQLREIAIKAALTDSKDKARYAKAEPYIKDLTESSSRRDQALGHLFQGVIDLERSGLADAARDIGTAKTTTDGKLRIAALNHLKLAAVGLPDIATAQALYGVALLLVGEPALGRQYLQVAQRMPNIETQYRVWAAWAIVQAGYPEEAEPIVADLLAGVAQRKQARELEPTLHLLKGEIHQARRTADELKRARAEYQKAIAAGQPETPALALRLAQIDLLLGDREAGARRIARLKQGQGSVAAEHLAILSLSEQGKKAEARALLDDARRRYPDSAELTGLDAALFLKDDQPDRADRALRDFLAKHPKHVDVVQMRARLLAGPLKKPAEARALLAGIADAAETSAPLVQLALLDLARRDDEAVVRTIKRIRNRWAEAAAADLLDAQLALAKNQSRAAAGFLEAALKKDPGNKIALFWKAQLDDRGGATAEAAKIFEEIAREKPVKELDDGLSLTTAANWALATMALENQDVDDAITRLEGLLKGGEAGELARSVRWQLAAARDAKGQWPAAKAEIESLLADSPTKPSTLERVRAANFYRMHGENATAAAQLDQVLHDEPGSSPAVALRAFLLAEKSPAKACALIRTAMAAKPQPPSIVLMLAAIENITPPVNEGLSRALAVLDAGLKAFPDAIELVQAKYRVLRLRNDPRGALAFVETKAKADPKGLFRRFLVDIHRDEARYDAAERIVRELLTQSPDDAELATMQVRLVALEAIAAAGRGDQAAESRLNARTAALVAGFRKQFPDEPSFLQAECELAARSGKVDKAMELTRAIDALDKTSPTGPLLRAQLAATQGWAQGIAKEYAEAVARAPRRADLRLALGQASLAVGQHDEALKQANWLLETNTAQPAAVLLKARALVQHDGPRAQVEARRAEAHRLLRNLLDKQPKFSAAYHLIAEIQVMAGARPDAVAILKAGLKAVPNDATGLAFLVQILCEPRENAEPAPRRDVQQAMALAERSGGQPNASGETCQALAVGLHKAGRPDLALPWAEKAAAKLDTWLVRLSLGDILLSKGEATTDAASARTLFERAVAQYDVVLKSQANSIEAVNNKAWILHEYLGKGPEALELAEGLAKRVDPATLPAEFHDTLGAIHESLGRGKDAETSYQDGLRKAPEHAILNYHLGRLLASDTERRSQAVGYLKKAEAGRSQLSPRAAAEVQTLLEKIDPR